MAIEYTLICDECGGIIHASRKSIRAVRGEAQLQVRAYCGQGVDRCAGCRIDRGAKLITGLAVKGSHSVGTQR